MSWGKAESWDNEQVEAWEHDEWLLMHEMGDDYYKLHMMHNHDSEGEDPFEAKRRIEWKKRKNPKLNTSRRQQRKKREATTGRQWQS